MGPCKCTNEHPGHLIRKKQYTKAEVAAKKAKKEAKAKAAVAAKADAVAQLVKMEVYQELEEVVRCQQVLRRQPSIFDVMANTSGKQFHWSEAEVDKLDSDDEEEPTPTGCGGAAGSKQVKVSEICINGRSTELNVPQ